MRKKYYIYITVIMVLMIMGIQCNTIYAEDGIDGIVEVDAGEEAVITNLKLLNDNKTITLTWECNMENATFEVYRSDSINSKYKLIDVTDVPEYTDIIYKTGRKYFYYVIPCKVENECNAYGKCSETVSCQVKLNTNKINRKDRTYASKIQLGWDKTQDANGYQIYRATSPRGKFKKIATTRRLSYTDKNVSPKKTYYYKVRSYNTYKGKIVSYSDYSRIYQVRSKVKNKKYERRIIVDSTKKKYSYNAMRSDLNLLNKKYPDYMSYSVEGITADGRNIYLVKLGNENAKKKIFIQATIHGREYMNSLLVMSQLEYYLRNWNCMYDKKCTYGDLFDQVCVYIIPMMNPDGVTISQYGIKGIRDKELRRKLYYMDGIDNYARWKANARGVNLNRNFGAFWVLEGSPDYANYTGPHADSEKETETFEKVVNENKFRFIISYHSMGSLVYWNIGQTGRIYNRTRELAIAISKHTGYPLGEKSKPEGLSYNWSIYNKKVPEIIIETGRMTCPAPVSEFKRIWKENKDLIAYMCSREH